jgi:spore coat polysaccharide biosynthesis protein SpsF
MKIVGIIQARMNSSRLPNKAMLSLHGYPIIEWVVRRTMNSSLVNDVVVVIPTNQIDDILETEVVRIGANVFRGDEFDVLSRYYNAALITNATHIVRICADNPLIDGAEIDNLIKYYFENPCDYAYNHIPLKNNYPDGIGAEIISVSLLNHLYSVTTKFEHREHSLSYIWENQYQFSIKTFNPINKKLHRPDLKFDVDTYEDFAYLQKKPIKIQDNTEAIIDLF